MKHYSFLLVFVSLLLFCACGNKTDSPTSSMTSTDLSRMDRVEIKEQRKIMVDSIVEKIDYVKLGETGDVLIGKVTDLLITPDHIIVGDTRQAKAVFIFDRAGNSQAVISRLGRGPQEYVDLRTIFLTPDQQAIGIVDNSMKKLLYFDLQGNFIKKQDLPFSCNGIEFLDDKTMMLVSDGWADKLPALETYPNKKDLLFFTDTTLQIQSSAIVNPFDVNKFYYAPVYKKKFDDRIYVGKAFGDTIYQVTLDEIFPRYWIDMTAIDGVANFGKDASNEKIDQARSTFDGNLYVESDDYALFFPSKDNIMFPVLFNKNTKKSYNIDIRSQTALGMYVLSAEFSDKNQFISVIPAFQFLTFCPDVPGVELRNEIKEGLTDEDNPVLLFYTLKDPE